MVSRRHARSSPRTISGLTFGGNLANPYPTGVLQPIGASKGADTFLGQIIGRFAPLDLQNGQNARTSSSLQRELPGTVAVEVGYTGSRGYDLTTDLDLNPTAGSVPDHQPRARSGRHRFSERALSRIRSPGCFPARA